MVRHAKTDGTEGAGTAAAAEQDWLRDAIWHAPDIHIGKVKVWNSVAALAYERGSGESSWRGDRHRLVLTRSLPGPVLIQVEQGRTRDALCPPGSLTFYPAGLETRTVHGSASFVQILWDPALLAALLPELGTITLELNFLFPFEDHLLGQIANSLAEEVGSGVADRLLLESLSTALAIRIAKRFAGQLPLASTAKGLSQERLRRVLDFVEAHLNEDLSLTSLADIACLSPFHFSRCFKHGMGIGPRHYVMQRRVERAKQIISRTDQPLAIVAQAAGFADQSHLTSIFRRETGLTPGRFRAALD